MFTIVIYPGNDHHLHEGSKSIRLRSLEAAIDSVLIIGELAGAEAVISGQGVDA